MESLGAPHAKVVWTYEDYRTLPDDGRRYEVIDGDLFVTPAPTITHQGASKRIYKALLLQVEDAGLGVVYDAPIDVMLSSIRVVQPDIVVVLKAREGIITERGIEGAPDIAVEILSQSTRTADLHAKRNLYASEGVREYWIVDTEEHTVEVLELAADGYRTRAVCKSGGRLDTGLVPLSLAIDEVFRR
jgi:Uma2 family endonuclease